MTDPLNSPQWSWDFKYRWELIVWCLAVLEMTQEDTFDLLWQDVANQLSWIAVHGSKTWVLQFSNRGATVLKPWYYDS